MNSSLNLALDSSASRAKRITVKTRKSVQDLSTFLSLFDNICGISLFYFHTFYSFDYYFFAFLFCGRGKQDLLLGTSTTAVAVVVVSSLLLLDELVELTDELLLGCA